MTGMDERLAKVAEVLPDAVGSVGLKYLPGMFRDRNTALERLTGGGEQILAALAPLLDEFRAEDEARGLNRGWGLGFKHTRAALGAGEPDAGAR